MRQQKVSVDVVRMVTSSAGYLLVAAAAWLLVKLVCACFWLPGELRRRGRAERARQLQERLLLSLAGEEEEEGEGEGEGEGGGEDGGDGGVTAGGPSTAAEHEEAEPSKPELRHRGARRVEAEAEALAEAEEEGPQGGDL
ncbi:uncharacterized protein LOC126428198 [Schistocerca serialis cubense]|uniref:uncharacterized protein LOC126428198 n=1 Tax=Schistocerca serialis cubense TaxID=2023355 RepID=UPI00214E7DFD|nr:uncharacterized protein LOC126428198 [Schistocerca serialis cubense]XP_049946069.1 uncharacterized protein LOC126428198 [Schistocerca serialis cubense]